MYHAAMEWVSELNSLHKDFDEFLTHNLLSFIVWTVNIQNTLPCFQWRSLPDVLPPRSQLLAKLPRSYCVLSEERNPVRKNQQQILFSMAYVGVLPRAAGFAVALSTPLLASMCSRSRLLRAPQDGLVVLDITDIPDTHEPKNLHVNLSPPTPWWHTAAVPVHPHSFLTSTLGGG